MARLSLMNFSFFTSLFKKNKASLKLPDTLLIKKLKDVCQKNNLLIYQNITIYHHTQSFFIPLLILDTKRGIYLFEHKEWSYDDLKNASISKATNQTSTTQSLAYEKAQEFIKQKFNELTHRDGISIHNFLLMENLNADEHKHLDISFQELLPHEKIIFSDSTEDEILTKLQKTPIIQNGESNIANIMGNLLIQYLIIDKNKTLHLSTKEQIEFIDADIEKITTLYGANGSGKTKTLLLKAILEKLKDSNKKIVMIKPTLLACDILKNQLLDIIERAIVEIDVTSIEIITPNEFISRNTKKIDLIMCDDIELLDADFITNLEQTHNRDALILAHNQKEEDSEYNLTHSFERNNKEIIFKKSNPHAKILQLVSTLLQKHPAKDILVVSNSLSKKKLYEDLEYFIEDKAFLLDSSKNLIDQELNSLLLSTYHDISEITSKIVLLSDVDTTSRGLVEFACNNAEEILYIVYENESEDIDYLRKKLESNKE